LGFRTLFLVCFCLSVCLSVRLPVCPLCLASYKCRSVVGATDLKERKGKKRKEGKGYAIHSQSSVELAQLTVLHTRLPFSQTVCLRGNWASIHLASQEFWKSREASMNEKSISRGNLRQALRRSIRCRQKDFRQNSPQSHGKPLPGRQPVEKRPCLSDALSSWR
jgi:hypothetical protein